MESLLTVFQFPDPILFTSASKVEDFNADIRKLAKSMMEITKAYPAVGLTACQVGTPINLMIVHDPENRVSYTMCNVNVLEGRGTQTGVEGCLSLEGQWKEIERPMTVFAEYQDINGKLKSVKLSGLAGRCLTHEYLHTLGLFPLDTVELPFLWNR